MKLRILTASLALAGGALLTVGCGDDTPSADTGPDGTTTEPDATTAPDTTTTEPADTVAPGTTPAPTTPTSAEPATTTTAAPGTTAAPVGSVETVETVDVLVHWAWTIPTHVATPERLGAGSRTVPADDVPLAALEALVEGPNEIETEIGMGTSIPDGTEVLGVTVADGLATADLTAAFSASSGSLDELTRLAQVVFTLTALDGIDRVAFAVEGELQDPVLSHGIVVGDGLDRDDVADVRPFILVEEPAPGELVEGDTLTVSGESNTFEANVQWNLVDGEGLIVDEGFTTATAGMGTWGEFTFTADLTDITTERAAIIVFETSPRDGTQVNVVEIPFLLTR